MKRICPRCSKEFQATGNRKYCSEECACFVIAEYHRERSRLVKERNIELRGKKLCPVCGIQFSGVGSRKNCSLKCSAISSHNRYLERNKAILEARSQHRINNSIQRNCMECSSTFLTTNKKQFFCSSDCRQVYYSEIKGIKNAEWEEFL